MVGVWLWTLALTGCQGDLSPDDTEHQAIVVEIPGEPLEGALLLRRISLDLRGVLPSVADLDAADADPAVMEGFVDDYLADERWADRIVDLFAEQWLTRVDEFNVSQDDYHLDPDLEFTFVRSVGEEPLRLMAYVAVNDLPWSEVVTADYTVANELLASIWPLDYPAGGSGWQAAYYTDDRPAGGVVMTNGLWWRYYTTPSNYSRSRAAALSRLLLCDDFLLRPIRFEALSLLEREDLNEATREVAACAGCHNTLDPLASALFGFWWFDLYDVAEMTSYHAEREGLGRYYLGLEPAWFGVPIDGAAQLGAMIVADDRFVSCAVRQAAQGLWRREAELVDFTALQVHEQAFQDAGQRFNTLVRSILAGPNYRVGAVTDNAGDDDLERLTTRRVMTAEQLADTIADLTGFLWTYEGFELMANDKRGYRILAGGLDGHDVTSPERDPNLTRTLLIKRLAQAGAEVVVQQELVDGGVPALFTEVDANDRPGDEAFTRQLTQLHRRLTGSIPDADRLALDEALWSDAYALTDAPGAWTTLLAAQLRDPAFWTY